MNENTDSALNIGGLGTVRIYVSVNFRTPDTFAHFGKFFKSFLRFEKNIWETLYLSKYGLYSEHETIDDRTQTMLLTLITMKDTGRRDLSLEELRGYAKKNSIQKIRPLNLFFFSTCSS